MFPFEHQGVNLDWLIQGCDGLITGPHVQYQRLEWLTQPCATSNAHTSTDWFFNHLQIRLQLLTLYRDYFPRQWGHTDADQRLLDFDVYTPRELELFELLDEHRFPCECDDATFASYFSAYPLTPDWNEIDWDDWDCLVQLSAGLSGYSDWQDVIDQYKLQDKAIAKPIPLKEVSFPKLKALCETLESPLKALDSAFDILEHDTGNLWLDSHYMEPETFEWNHAAIERLTQTYQDAKKRLEAFNDLNEWLYEQPERIGLLVNLWNSAAIEPQSVQLELPFFTTISSEQWATGTYRQELQAQRQRYAQIINGND